MDAERAEAELGSEGGVSAELRGERMDALSFAAGVLASLVAWLLVTHGLRPKLVWTDTRTKRYFPEGSDPPWGCRSTVRNRRLLRDALDVRAYGRIRIRGL